MKIIFPFHLLHTEKRIGGWVNKLMSPSFVQGVLEERVFAMVTVVVRLRFLKIKWRDLITIIYTEH